MANRLWNVLTFTNVAAGATVALPHLLNNNGQALKPDFEWGNNPNFDIDADTTNATVTNNAGTAQTIEVLVCSIHTIIRVFGGTSIPNLSPKPYVLVGGGQSGGGTGTTTQRYVATGGESDFMVTLTVPRANDSYVVTPALAGVASIVGVDCPDTAAGDRTTTQFRVITSAPLTAGDQIDFTFVSR